MRYLLAPDMDVKLLEEMMNYRLFTPMVALRPRLINSDELIKMTNYSPSEVYK